MKTNLGLVEHCKTALKEKWGYVWGTFGQVLTDNLLNQKIKQYPSHVGNHKSFITKNYINKRAADCVGLIKSYMWWDKDNPKYVASTDVNANMMYNNATEKGPISTLPEIPGLCVWKQGHIGVYIGNGQVIEARGTKQGVIQSPLKGVGSVAWTHWLKCHFIEYVENKEYIALNILGKKIKAEGKFENNTNFVLFKRGNQLGYVSVREYLEPLGLAISWDEKTRTVVVK